LLTLSYSEGFNNLDQDTKGVVEMMLGHSPTLSQRPEPQKHPVQEMNLDDLVQGPADMLQAVQITDKSEAIKPRVDPSKDANTDKGNLLQEFILEHLSFVSMRDREAEVAEAHQKTFERIFDSDLPKNIGGNFLQWLQDNNEGIYWIKGKAGSGKSTLMRFIHDHRKTVK
jgi:hypothetical protein